MNEQTVEVIRQLLDWHKQKVENLKLVTEHVEAGIRVADKNGDETELTAEQCVGVRFGVSLALEHLGRLPIELRETDDEEE